MLRAVLAHHQVTLHVCNFGDYFVLKFKISSRQEGYMLCHTICMRYILLD
jgi:hypothetical protein